MYGFSHLYREYDIRGTCWRTDDYADTMVVNTPPQISKSISEKILETYAIDFDGDDKLDFLVYVKNETSDESFAFELWYASSFKLVKRVPKYISDYDYPSIGLHQPYWNEKLNCLDPY